MPTEGRILVEPDVAGGNPIRTVVQSTQAADEGAVSNKDVQVMVLGDPDTPANLASVGSGGMGVNGGTLTTTSGAIAAGATGTVGPLNVARAGNVTFTVKNTVAASAWAGAPVLVFEQSDDSTSWEALPVVRSGSGQVASTFTLGAGAANAELNFEAAVEAVSFVRCRVTTGPTTNGLTVVIAGGGMPFPQGNTVLTHPLDGHRFTVVSATSPFTPPNTSTALQPFLILPNPSTSGVLIRILRVRLEMTIGTAALLRLVFFRNLVMPTGGTSTASPSVPLSRGFSLSPTAYNLTAYTAVPTSNSGPSVVAIRRQWVPTIAAGAPAVMELTFGSGRPGSAFTIVPNWYFAVGFDAAPATAVSLNAEVEWTEEPV